MRFLLGAVAVLCFVLIALKVLSGPLYASYSPSECQAAYSRARTLADSLRVDLHRMPRVAGADHRCGEVRRVRADSTQIARATP